MSGWLYLIKNRDLYKIGITKNFENRMRQLKPDNVVAKLYTSEFMKLEKELHNRYKNFRIPQTEYFRLENHHLVEIKQRISRLNYPISMILEIFLKSLLFLILVNFFVFLFLSLYFNDLNILIHKSLICMEKITAGYSIFSIFIHSGKYLSLRNEFKYRFLRLILFIIVAFLFRRASIFF